MGPATQHLLWVPGSACWARDAERAFVEATVVSVTGSNAKVTVPGSDDKSGIERQCKLDELFPRSADHRCVTDMDDLQELNMASVLNNVELLFGQQQRANPGEGPNTIYSSVGPVLIAMNPFTPLPLYGDAWTRAYHSASGDHRTSKTLGPHCYRTMEEALAGLRNVGHQSVVICGESGAGKTVTNRKMIEYICQVQATSNTAAQGEVADVQQIAEANVLLESFGNAKTTRNGNSSRFGKYTRLDFDKNRSYGITGCSVEHYLLERSRVAGAPQNERNYHIFYQLLRSGTGKDLQLEGGPEAFAYTQQGSESPGFDDAKDFQELCGVMVKAGFTPTDRHRIFETVAAVLHLGNVEFSGSKDSAKVDTGPVPSLERASDLLGVNPTDLGRAMASSLIKVPNSSVPIRKEISVEFAQAQRDVVAKTIYSRLFDMIVTTIGEMLGGGRESQQTDTNRQLATVGLLDIFGFEDMMVNGFEQLFINLTNERIQHLFNSIMFERELAVYRQEGIEAAFDPGMNNLDCVRLFNQSRPPGIVKLLSESTLMKNGRDGAAFVQVLNSSFACHSHYKVCDPQDAQRTARAKGLRSVGRGGLSLDYRECFQVRHYAGTVMYTVKGWVPRSVDALLPHISEVLASSNKPNIRLLFAQEESNGKATVGEKFCAQLEVLAETLEQGETRFVRCIKSNPQMVPGVFNRPLVLEQLLHGGVISALEQRHRGLPERIDYDHFCQEYRMLGPRCPGCSSRMHCEQLLRSIFGAEAEKQNQYAMGKTKIFMKSHLLAFLRAVMSLRVRNLAKRLQRQWRLHMGTERIRKVEEAWEKFEAADGLARARAIDALPSVARALADGREKIGAVVQLLGDARSAHGADIHKIAAALPNEKIRPLYSIAEAVDAVVVRVSQRKVAAEEVLALRITRAMDTVLRLMGRVITVERECGEVADAISEEEREKCEIVCRKAREHLQALQVSDLPSLKLAGPVGINLDGYEDVSSAEVCPSLSELLEQTTGFVTEAEAVGQEILWVRRAFQKAVEEVQGEQEAALAALEALQEQARRCIAEGLDGIVEPVDVAWQRQADAQEVLQAARDADGYRDAAAAFVAAVRDAELTVDRGREELAKREAEKQERIALQAQLDAMQQQLAEKRVLVRQSMEVRMAKISGMAQLSHEVDSIEQETAALRGRAVGRTLEDWRSDIQDVAQRARVLLDAIDVQVTQATKARQEEFNRRMGAFTQSSDAKPAQAEITSPTAFLESEGLLAHEASLLEILRLVQTMQEAGAPRSGVQRCLNHWVKSTWVPGGSPMVPGGSPMVRQASEPMPAIAERKFRKWNTSMGA